MIISKTNEKKEIEEEVEIFEEAEQPNVFSDEFRADLRELLERYGAQIIYSRTDFLEITSSQTFRAGAYTVAVDVSL